MQQVLWTIGWKTGNSFLHLRFYPSFFSNRNDPILARPFKQILERYREKKKKEQRERESEREREIERKRERETKTDKRERKKRKRGYIYYIKKKGYCCVPRGSGSGSCSGEGERSAPLCRLSLQCVWERERKVERQNKLRPRRKKVSTLPVDRKKESHNWEMPQRERMARSVWLCENHERETKKRQKRQQLFSQLDAMTQLTVEHDA